MLMAWLLVLLPAMLAGLVQGLTGFGAAIIMMIFLPQLLPMDQSAGVAGLIMFASVAAWSVHLGQVLDVQLLRRLLGGLLVGLAVYFTVSRRETTRQFPWYVAGVFMIVSGFFNGLFGIGGPLMALYFLSLAKSTAEYVGNLQAFFLIDVFYITTIRVSNGILTPSVTPWIAIGMVGAFVGTAVAARILPKLPMTAVKQLIYVFIGLSGGYYLIF